jgi:hypothetical protein
MSDIVYGQPDPLPIISKDLRELVPNSGRPFPKTENQLARRSSLYVAARRAGIKISIRSIKDDPDNFMVWRVQ